MPRPRLHCVVTGCFNSTTVKPNLSYFRLPSKTERRAEWLRVICREDLVDKPSQNYVVCEEHFRPQDMISGSSRKNLRQHTYPTLNLPDEHKKDANIQTEFVPILRPYEFDNAKPSSSKDMTVPASSEGTNSSTKGRQTNQEARDIVFKLYLYFATEASRFKKSSNASYFNKIQERVARATGISQRTVYNILKSQNVKGSMTEQKRVQKRRREKGSDSESDTDKPGPSKKGRKAVSSTVTTSVISDPPPLAPLPNVLINPDPDSKESGSEVLVVEFDPSIVKQEDIIEELDTSIVKNEESEEFDITVVKNVNNIEEFDESIVKFETWSDSEE